MRRTYRYRLYPTRTQRQQLWQTLGACRFVYNWALETKQTTYEQEGTNLSWYDLNNRLPDLKATHPFLREVPAQTLQQAIKRVHLAFQHFFRRLREGAEKPGYPRFKRRKAPRHSFEVPQWFTIDVAARRVRLPKIGLINTRFHRPFTGTPRTCSVVATSSGKFFISIVVEDGTPPPTKQPVTPTKTIGIDVGLTTYVTLSTGDKVDNPRHLKSTLQRLRVLQRRLSRKRQGSRNREKARRRLARAYERVANQRTDFQHKLSTRLIRENQAICIESLNIGGMIQNRRLAQSIADAGWSRFLRLLEYKAEWYGVTLMVVGRFAPTSKRCHHCGNINAALELSDRTWTCGACGMVHDRDVNAAQNIKLMGLHSLRTPREPREEPVERSAVADAMKQEAPSLRAG
jgi:putative transposase